MTTRDDRQLPSLKRLQAVDSSIPDVQDQLDEIRLILELDHQDYSSDQWDGGYSRALWAVSWLMKKFKHSSSGPEFRSSAKSWALLRDLLAVLSSLDTASVLDLSDLWTCIELALLESYHVNDELATGNPVDGSTTSVSAGPENSEEPPEFVSQGTSGKRKRKTENHSDQVHKKKKVSRDTVEEATFLRRMNADVFHGIAECLRVLQGTSDYKQSGERSISFQPGTTTLHVECRQASRILGGALTGTLALISPEDNDGTYLKDSETFFDVWEHRTSHDADMSLVAAESFSKNCLIASIQLMLVLQNRPSATRTSCSRLVERLLARHVILPAKQAFKLSRQAQNSGISNGSNTEDLLTRVLTPLKESLSSSNVPGAQNTSRHQAQLSQSPSILFATALKCSRLSSPKQKIIEGPWLRHLFSELVVLCGYNLASSGSTSGPSTTLIAVNGLLEQALAQGVPLNRQLLGNVLVQGSGLWPTPDNGQLSDAVDWHMVSLVILLEPGIFISTDETNAHLPKGHEAPLQVLLEHVSSQSYNWTGARSMQHTHDMIIDGVIIPILNAFVSARNLPRFLEVWQGALDSADTQGAHKKAREEIYTSSIWEHDRVVRAVAEEVERSLTTSQVSQSLGFLDDTLIQYPSIGNISLQTSLITGLRNPDIVVPLLPKIEALLKNCIELLASSSGDSHQRTRTWQLLASAYVVWTTVVRPERLVAELDLKDEQQENSSLKLGRITTCITKAAKLAAVKKTAGTISECLESISCLQSLESSTKERNLGFPQVQACVNGFLDATKSLLDLEQKQSNADWKQPLASTLLRSWKLLDRAKSSKTLRSSMADAVKLLMEQTTFESTMWNGLVREAKDHYQDRSKEIDVLNELLDCLLYYGDTYLSEDQQSAESRQHYYQAWLNIPPQSVSEDHRSRLLSALVINHIRSKSPMNLLDWTRFLILWGNMLRLSAGNVGEKHDEALWKARKYLSKALNEDQEALEGTKRDCLNAFKELAKVIFEDEGVRQRYLPKRIMSFVQVKGSETSSLIDAPATLALFQGIFAITTSEHEKDMQDAKDMIFRPFCDCLDQWTTAGNFNRSLLLDTISALEPSKRKEAKLLQEKLTAMNEFDDTTMLPRFRLFVRAARSTEQIPQMHLSTLAAARQILQRTVTRRGLRQVESTLANLFQSLSDDAVKDLNETLGGAELDNSNLRLLYTAITTRTDWAKINDVSPLVSDLSQVLTNNNTAQGGHTLATATLTALLRLKGARPSQFATEHLLASLAHLVSPSGPAHATPSLYPRLCTLTHLLLARGPYRTHLRSRLHLLLPLLHGLLRCLFIPTDRAPLPQPPWLRSHPLSTAHATHYARLLSALADPAPSAVASYAPTAKDGASGPLTDATALARAHMARFAPLLIAELCRCLLRGRYCADGVAEALRPGVWCLFGLLGTEEMEALAAGMSSAGREVLRGLVAEWRRVGGGNGGNRKVRR